MLYSFPHLKHLQCDNVEYFPHGKMAMVNYGQGRLFFEIAIEIDQTVFIVSENKTGVVDVIGMPRAFAERASHPNISPALVFTLGQASRPAA